MSNTNKTMKNLTVSKVLCRLSVILIPVFCLALSFGGYQTLMWKQQTQGLPEGNVVCYMMLASGVFCGIAGAIAIAHLFFMLRRIEKGEVFTAVNVRTLSIISICSLVFLFAGIVDAILAKCLFLAAVGVAAGFIGFLVWVIHDAFAKAVELQNDADATI